MNQHWLDFSEIHLVCIAAHLLGIDWVHKTMFMLVTMPTFKPVTTTVYLPITNQQATTQVIIVSAVLPCLIWIAIFNSVLALQEVTLLASNILFKKSKQQWHTRSYLLIRHFYFSEILSLLDGILMSHHCHW